MGKQCVTVVQDAVERHFRLSGYPWMPGAVLWGQAAVQRPVRVEVVWKRKLAGDRPGTYPGVDARVTFEYRVKPSGARWFRREVDRDTEQFTAFVHADAPHAWVYRWNEPDEDAPAARLAPPVVAFPAWLRELLVAHAPSGAVTAGEAGPDGCGCAPCEAARERTARWLLRHGAILC